MAAKGKDAAVKKQKSLERLFASAARSDDVDIKAFAEKTLPTIRQHLQMAEQLEQGAAATSGTSR